MAKLTTDPAPAQVDGPVLAGRPRDTAERPAAPQPPRRSRVAATRSLVDTVDEGVHALDDLNDPGRQVTSGALEASLRAALDDQQRSSAPDADTGALAGLAATLRIACAHLNAHDLVEARLVLIALRDALVPRDRTGDGRERRAATRARAAVDAQTATMARRVMLEQAVGLVLGHGCTSAPVALASLRSHAGRHGVSVDDLARDVVAGRIAPRAVL